MNLADLKKELLTQRKARNKVGVSVISLLIGEIETEEKKGNTVDVFGKINKVISNNRDTLALRFDEILIEENAFLQNLLPKGLTEDEIIAILDTLKPKQNDIGFVMKHFKDQYAGRYNGGALSQIVKNYLK